MIGEQSHYLNGNGGVTIQFSHLLLVIDRTDADVDLVILIASLSQSVLHFYMKNKMSCR
jgi:hypothetical protein